jgi:diadenosine tetraphosphate (Ap4A) HIT family hydrolase
MIKIKELPYSIVYLNRDQKYKGRCIVALKEHKNEYFELSAEQNAGYFAEIALTAKAVFNAFKPNKINYGTFGDLVPHVHVHIVPKYEGGFLWGKFFRDDSEKEILSEAEYKEIIGKISKEIESLL